MDSSNVQSWARRYSLMGDSARLTLLLLIHHAGPVRLPELARATGRSGSAVTQTLRVLRDHGAITGRRCGGTVEYRLADNALAALLGLVAVHDGLLVASLTTIAQARAAEARAAQAAGSSWE